MLRSDVFRPQTRKGLSTKALDMLKNDRCDTQSTDKLHPRKLQRVLLLQAARHATANDVTLIGRRAPRDFVATAPDLDRG